MTPQQVHNKAADLIEEQGFVKWKLRSPEGICLVNALCIASIGEDFQNQEQHIVARIQPSLDLMGKKANTEPNPLYLSDWNNNESITKEVVINILRTPYDNSKPSE